MERSQGPGNVVVYSFDGYVVDPRALELRAPDGSRVEIPPQAFDLLVYLIRNRGRVVSKTELFDALWGDVSVGDNSLSQSVWAARRAVQDTGGKQRVIKNVRGRGYRFVAELDDHGEPAEVAPGAAPTPSSEPAAAAEAEPAPAPPAPPIVGRQGELERLTRALQDAAAGRPRICLLAGDAGIGKTTLLDAIGTEARARGARVLPARSVEAEGVPPFWLWQQVVRECVRRTPEAEVGALLGAAAGDLSRLMPELQAYLSEGRLAPERSAAEERFHVFEGVTQVLRRASERQVVVITLDDLHWADAPSLLLLEYLAGNIGEGRLLVCGGHRATEMPAHLSRAVAAVLRAPGAELLELSGLPPSALCELLSLHGRERPSARLVERVAALTAGNPLFVEHLVRDIVDGDDGDGLELPREAVALVRRRVASLSSETVEILCVASVLGREFRLADLRRAVSLDADVVLDRLDEAVRGGVLVLETPNLGAYRFAHPTLREAVYADVPHGRRLRLHERIADGIVEAYAADPGARLSEIAHHYFEAASGGAADKALHYGRMAAERAQRATAYEDAIAHYRRALQVLELIEPVDERLRCTLLLELANAMRSIPLPIEQTQAVFAEVVEHARRLGAPDLLAEAALSHAGRGPRRKMLYREIGTIDPVEIEMLESALDAVGEAPSAHRALLCGWLAWTLYNSGQVERRHALADEAVSVARRLDDPELLAETLVVHANAIHGPPRLDARIDALSEVIDMLSKKPATGLLLDATSSRAWARFERGELAAAEVDVESTVRLCLELQMSRHTAYAWRMLRLYSDARFEEMAELAAQAAPAPPTVRQREDQAAAIRLFMIRYLQGRVEENVKPLEQLAERFPLPVGWNCGLLSSYANTGRFEEAQQGLDRLRATAFSAVPVDHNWMSSMGFLAGTAAEIGDRRSAEMLYEMLAPYAGRVALIGIAGPPLGVVDQFLGQLTTCLGRYDDAVAHLERAIELEHQLGLSAWAAYAETRLVDALVQRQQPGDALLARAHLESARQYADTRDVRLLTDRIERLDDPVARLERAAGHSDPTHVIRH